jgi:hypothetical protein
VEKPACKAPRSAGGGRSLGSQVQGAGPEDGLQILRAASCCGMTPFG